MIIPDKEIEKAAFVGWVTSTCLNNARERKALYDKRRAYYLFGQYAMQPVRLNRMRSHIGLVSSFLYTPDGLQYSLSASDDSDEGQIAKYVALQDEFNESIHNSGLADVISQTVDWSLVYDTMILKSGWNEVTEQFSVIPISPVNFGVFREDINEFSEQEAFSHRMILDYDDACERMRRAGLSNRIPELKSSAGPSDEKFPAVLTNLLITQSAGPSLMGTIQGQVNQDLVSTPNYQATNPQNMVEFYETWIWDSEAEDYRIFTTIAPDIILSDSAITIGALKQAGKIKTKYASDTNYFLPQENPFTVFTPYKLYDYFWGTSHVEDLIPLQDWMTERLTQIDDILKRQARPPKSFVGFEGLTDEKAAAFGGPDSWVFDSSPTGKVDVMAPQMPQDLFAEFNEIGNLFLEQSGLTEILAGKSSGGARGGKQNKQLQVTGGGKIRRTALGLEDSIVRIGDICLKLMMKNSTQEMFASDGSAFIPSQLPMDYKLRCSGHAQSPLFKEETQVLAMELFKAQAISREELIRVLNPVQKDAMIYELRKREKAEAEAHRQEMLNGATSSKGKKGGK